MALVAQFTSGLVLICYLGSLSCLQHLASLPCVGTRLAFESTCLIRQDSTGCLQLISSGDASLGGLFHCLVGPAQLEDSASGSVSFFTWQDRFRLTSILGAHSSTLGIASLLLAGTALSNGALDTWSCGGGNTRVLKFDATTLNFFVLSRYIIRAPLGSEGWIIGVHSLEGVIGGHSWLGLFIPSCLCSPWVVRQCDSGPCRAVGLNHCVHRLVSISPRSHSTAKVDNIVVLESSRHMLHLVHSTQLEV